jgi:hypothetical protein
MTLSLIQDDASREFLKMNGTELLNSQLGVQVFNSQELLRQTEMLKQLITQNNTSNTPMSGLAEVIYTESPARIIEILREAEKKIQEQQQAQQQHEAEMQQTAIKAEQDKVDKQNAWQANQNELDREASIREKVISVTNFDQDVQGNGVVDVVGIGKLELDKQRFAHDKTIASQETSSKLFAEANKARAEKDKNETAKAIKKQELLVKGQEMANKIRVEKEKLLQVETQNKNQIDLANKSHESLLAGKNKDLELKDKDLKLKDKDLELKDKDLAIKAVAQGAIKKTTGHEVAGSKHALETDKKLNNQKLTQTKAVDKLKLATQKKLEAEKIKKAKENKPTPKK